MMNTQKKFGLSVIIAFAIVYIVWGSTYFFIHKALKGFDPFMLGAIRYTIAGLLMLGWCKLQGYEIFNRTSIKHAGVTGLLLLFIDTGIIIWVEQFMASGLVAIMAASAAIWFVILDKPNWKVNFTSVTTISGLFMGFLGVLMLFGEQLAEGAGTAAGRENLLGMILLLIGAIAWTVGSLYSKYYGAKTEETKNTHVMVGTAWQILIAGIAFSVTTVATGEAANFNLANIPAEAWWAMLYLIVFGSIIAYSAYIWLLSVRSATEVSTYAYVNPIVAVVLSLFLTDEIITSVQITGLAIILLSVFLINWNTYFGSTENLKIRRLKKIQRNHSGLRQKIKKNVHPSTNDTSEDLFV